MAMPASVTQFFYFLSRHRGHVEWRGDVAWVESERPEFTFAVVSGLNVDTETFERFSTIYLMSGVEVDLPARGYLAASSVTFMSSTSDPSQWPTGPQMNIWRASDVTSMAAFSDTQAKGFLETPEAHSVWFPFLEAANRRNLEDPKQFFCIGSLDGEFAGTTLVIDEDGTFGLYAVATPPQHRKKGIATHVMRESLRISGHQAGQPIVLQVVSDSYAERLYQKLGFREDARALVFRRASISSCSS